MKWTCENQCGAELTEKDVEKALNQTPYNPDMTPEEVESILFYTCPNCKGTTEFIREKNTESSSKPGNDASQGGKSGQNRNGTHQTTKPFSVKS